MTIDLLNPAQAYAASYSCQPTWPIHYQAKPDRLIFQAPCDLKIEVPLHFPDRASEPIDVLTIRRSGSPLAKTVGGYCEIYQRTEQLAYNPSTGLSDPVLCSPLAWFFSRETTGGGTGSHSYPSRAEAELGLVARIWMDIEMLERKVEWMRNGDKMPASGRGFHRVPETQVIRCNGIHYTIGKEPSAAELRYDRSLFGFGGHRFRFRLLATGEIIESHNVWCQGDIPTEYRGLLADNAEQVHDE